jgi:hypothetical protein
MDMSFVLLVSMGFLTSVVMAGLFQTVTTVVRRVNENRPEGKALSACQA